MGAGGREGGAVRNLIADIINLFGGQLSFIESLPHRESRRFRWRDVSDMKEPGHYESFVGNEAHDGISATAMVAK